MAEPSRTTEPYVFLSYASAERERAVSIADALEAAGIRVWIDRAAIAGGTSWSTAIVRGIRNCAALAVLCSPVSVRSPNVQRELNLAVEHARPLLPLLLTATEFPDEVQYALTGRQRIELLARPWDAWLPEVLRALAGFALAPRPLLTQAVPGAGPPAAAQNPLPEPAALHLPTPLTSFIGRAQELAEITALLGTTRLLTLTGPGGTGKTRLAITAARQVADQFPDGAWFVDLSSIVDAAGVIPAIARVLDVRESEGRSLAVSLAAYLRRKRLLLVLDNVEQVVAAAMALYDLLAEAPGLSLLVTSRILLRVGGEQEYAVPPLLPPGAGAHLDLSLLRENPAVQLFLDRARALQPDLALTTESLRAIGAICSRLDGLPLAIELAAARVKLLSPVQLLARLEHRLLILTGGARSSPQRQQTLRATIAWSWDLLSAAEQVLFRRLGVFAGGWTLAAAEAICAAGGELDVLEGLAALVDQSLVRQTLVNDEPRFSLLATLQEFALEQLEASGEASALRREHAAYYCALTEAADAAYWCSGRAQQDVIRPLAPEWDNLFLALGWALAEQDASVGLRLGGALGPSFYIRAPIEGQQWLTRLLALPAATAPGCARGRALFGAGVCAVARGEVPDAIAYWEEAALCLRAEEDLPTLSRTLAFLSVYLPATELNRVHALTEEALQLARALGDTYGIAFVEAEVGMALLGHGENSTATRVHLEEALRLAHSLDSDWVTMFALMELAMLAAADGQQEEARALLYEALPLVDALGDRAFGAYIRLGLAQLAISAGDQDEAVAHWRKALLQAQEMGSAAAAAPCLAGIAGLLSAQRRYDLAVRLLAASDRLRQAAEQHPLHGPQFQVAFTSALAATRAGLSPEAFAQAWAVGQALSLDQVTDLALAELASCSPPTGSTRSVVS
ncbi:MAG: ATP-binding protein [Dehalococcoidia bacterium]